MKYSTWYAINHLPRFRENDLREGPPQSDRAERAGCPSREHLSSVGGGDPLSEPSYSCHVRSSASWVVPCSWPIRGANGSGRGVPFWQSAGCRLGPGALGSRIAIARAVASQAEGRLSISTPLTSLRCRRARRHPWENESASPEPVRNEPRTHRRQSAGRPTILSAAFFTINMGL